MGSTNFIANFGDGAKRFGKKAWKVTKKSILVVGLIIAIIFGVAFFVIANLVSFVFSPVWMPLAYTFNPEWLAKKIAQPMADEPQEMFLEGRHLAVFIFGWIWKWLGTRSWAPRKARYEFLKEFGTLREKPVKVQVQFWEDCDFKTNNFRIGISEEARLEVLRNLLWNGDYEQLMKLNENVSAEDRGRFLASLLYALNSIDGANEKALVSKVVSSLGENPFDIKNLTEQELWQLWELSNDMKLFVLLKSGLTVERLKRLLEMPDRAVAIRILDLYLDARTPNNQAVSFLLKKAEADDSLFPLVKKIILKNGLSEDLIDMVISEMDGDFEDKVVDIIKAYADRMLLREDGVSLNPSPQKREAEKIERWRKYCSMEEIHELAQLEMNFEQYKIFAQSGQHLSEEVLKKRLSRTSNPDFFKEIVRNELENLDDDLVTICMASPWKYAILVDIAAENAEAEKAEAEQEAENAEAEKEAQDY